MQVTKGTWRMREQCVPGSLSSSPAQEPGNEANKIHVYISLTVIPKTMQLTCYLDPTDVVSIDANWWCGSQHFYSKRRSLVYQARPSFTFQKTSHISGR